MAIKITEECINCGACEPECPNNAIYEGGVEWAITDGTTVKGSFTLLDGTVVDAAHRNAPVSAKLRNIKFSKALTIILESVGGGTTKLSYTIDDGVSLNLVDPHLTGWLDNDADIHPIRYLCRNDAPPPAIKPAA